MTFGHKLKDAMLKARARHPEGKMSDDDWVRIANETAAAHFKRRKPVDKLEAEKCREALARACGIIALAQMTEAGWRPIRKALTEIRKVFEGTDEQLILEIQRRAAAYRTRHPTWELTAPALAKYWANFGRLAKEVDKAPPEPAGWQGFMRKHRDGWVRITEETRDGIPLPAWKSLRLDEQQQIVEIMKHEGAL